MKKIIALLSIVCFLLISGMLAAQKNGKDSNRTKPFVLGVIDEIQSKELSEKRILNIYLPEGYNKNDTTKYPVVYLLDGSADEDFIHVVGLYQFNNFSWINRVPKSIIVGIATVDRRRDFTFPTRIEVDKKDIRPLVIRNSLSISLKKSCSPTSKTIIKPLLQKPS